MKRLFTVIVSVVACARHQAPAPFVSGLGTLVVTLRDTVGSDSLVRGSVCAAIREYTRCASETRGSRFTIHDLPPATYDLIANCPRTSNGFPGFSVTIGRAVLEMTNEVVVERTVRVGYGPCDSRPFQRKRGEMTGHHSYGFEENSLTFCRPGDWFSPRDSIHRTILTNANERVWRGVKWPKSGQLFDGAQMIDSMVYRYYFVRLEGTLEGPGSYGHMGVASYQFVVDKVLDVRTPTESDCR